MAMELETDSSRDDQTVAGLSSAEELEEEKEVVPDFQRSMRRDRKRTLILPKDKDVEETKDFIPLRGDTKAKPKPTASKSGVSVFVRFRPDNETEMRNGNECVTYFPDQTSVAVSSNGLTHKFTFEQIMGVDVNQEELFNTACIPLTEKVLEGYNTAVVAYGQTGSGKTYSLLGPGYDNLTNIMKKKDPEQFGVTPRLIQNMFHRVYTSYEPGVYYTIGFSYIEIYNEKIRDCLTPAKSQLQVYQDVEKGLWVTDATKVPVKNIHEVYKLITSGSKERTTAATKSNQESSRSHALIILTIEKEYQHKGIKRAAQLYIVDLCGSEKISKTGAEAERLKEAQNINTSLLALGNVISALCEKRNHVPYRDSKLTRLLQNCFGGNAYTTLILTCSSNSYNSLETLSTLRFGDRANKVHNKPTINQTESIDEMRRMLGEATFKLASAQRVIRDLCNKNEELESLVYELSQSLAPQQKRMFTNRYKVALPEKPRCPANTMGANCFYLVFVFLECREVLLCQRVNKLWRRHASNEMLFKFILKHLMYGQITLEGRCNDDFINEKWKNDDLEFDQIPSYKDFFKDKAGKLYKVENYKSYVDQSQVTTKGLSLFPKSTS